MLLTWSQTNDLITAVYMNVDLAIQTFPKIPQDKKKYLLINFSWLE